MLSTAYIIKTAGRLTDKYRTRNPGELCALLGIRVYEKDLGKKLKGFFVCISRQSSIVIDSNINGVMQRILTAHELGHAVLHKEAAAISGFRETGLFTGTDPMEHEANLFAAELLLSDEDVLEKLKFLPFFDAAKALGVPAVFLDYKLTALREKGYGVGSMDLTRSDILKKDLHEYEAI